MPNEHLLCKKVQETESFLVNTKLWQKVDINVNVTFKHTHTQMTMLPALSHCLFLSAAPCRQTCHTCSRQPEPKSTRPHPKHLTFHHICWQPGAQNTQRKPPFPNSPTAPSCSLSVSGLEGEKKEFTYMLLNYGLPTSKDLQKNLIFIRSRKPAMTLKCRVRLPFFF